MGITAKLRALRVEKRVTQEQMAALLGIDRTHISKVERGQASFSIEVLERYLDILGYRLVIEKGRGPDAAEMLNQLDQRERLVAEQLVATLPHVPPAVLSTLEGMVEHWRSLFASSGPAGPKA